jgi:hypothetical protein
MPPVLRKTVAQEKATLSHVDDDLAPAVKNAPTKAIVALATELVGTFIGWINDPALLAQHVSMKSSVSYSVPAALSARIVTMADVLKGGTASGRSTSPVPRLSLNPPWSRGSWSILVRD